ncbi:MAG: hypothetical protein RIC14_12870 [Filomicrobium sp.]
MSEYEVVRGEIEASAEAYVATNADVDVSKAKRETHNQRQADENDWAQQLLNRWIRCGESVGNRHHRNLEQRASEMAEGPVLGVIDTKDMPEVDFGF